ncbi:lipocalin family protein [Aliiruegeria haliotis]|uniref:lipocalin family protein n=1 Tax=Aliiruegeria haliotis TaxID=1280846 RepID=UPI001FE4D8C2|nr:lipocalin family protein [Aliiruegeria haliotis]
MSPAIAETYRDRTVEITPVSVLHIERHLGKWYEIAQFPNSFGKRCEGVTAGYAHTADGRGCQPSANSSLQDQYLCPLCRTELTPLGTSGSAVLLEAVS